MTSIIVCNLPPINNIDLHILFGQIGEIIDLVRIDNCCIIVYYNEEDAFDAIDLYDGRYLRGHRLLVTFEN